MASKNSNLTPREKAKKTRRTIIILVAELLVLAVVLLFFFVINKGTQVQKIVINEDKIGIEENLENVEELDKYMNVALFGIDARNGSLEESHRSDTIMIASINKETKEVKLVSVYRDTYLNVNGSYNKVNAAYSLGGPENAVATLNSNLNLNIKDFVSVGFKGVVDTVDALGGVWVEVDSAEIKHLNNYAKCIAEDLDMQATYVEETGYQLLNGLQATAYCRIRYTAGDDFKRTERQREVLQAIMDEAQKTDAATVNNIADSVFPNIATTLSLEEILDLLGDVQNYTIAENSGWPFDTNITTATVGSKSVVIPMNLEENVVMLHEFLFDEMDYEISDTVLEYSQDIIDETSPYIVQ